MNTNSLAQQVYYAEPSLDSAGQPSISLTQGVIYNFVGNEFALSKSRFWSKIHDPVSNTYNHLAREDRRLTPMEHLRHLKTSSPECQSLPPLKSKMSSQQLQTHSLRGETCR